MLSFISQASLVPALLALAVPWAPLTTENNARSAESLRPALLVTKGGSGLVHSLQESTQLP